jgi:uncharacterized protein YhaN
VKGMTKLTIALAATLILIIAIGAYQWGRNREKERGWKEREKQGNAVIAAKDEALAAKDHELSGITADLLKLSGEIAALKSDVATAKAAVSERDKQLRDLPPEHLVTEARELLNTDGITLAPDGEHVIFTVAAFTEAVVRVAHEQKLTMDYVPRLEAMITKQNEKILKLEAGMENLRGQVSDWTGKYDELKSMFDDFKKVKERSWLARAIDTGGKVALGIVAGLGLGGVI